MLPRVFRRGMASAAVKLERDALLRRIHAPFQGLPQESLEYIQLARSGKAWEDFHCPQDSDKMGYTRLNKECSATLQEIDRIRESMKQTPASIAKQLVAEYSYQSVKIENNGLGLADSHDIYDALAATMFQGIDMPSTSLPTLVQTRLPTAGQLLPNADQGQVLELRNHIVASQWIAETAPRAAGTHGLGEEDVCLLSALTMKDQGTEGFYPYSFGPRVPLGHYRMAPIAVRSNPLRVFPYHVEVPACMQRFFAWKAKEHQEQKLHSLVLACQITAYVLHIHPFLDGNGRVGRMIMHDYLLRQAYLPILFQPLDREDYIAMIKDAQDGKPDAFVHSVVTTQLEAMLSFHTDYMI